MSAYSTKNERGVVNTISSPKRTWRLLSAKCIVLICAFAPVLSVRADERLALPNGADIDGGDLAAALLLNPCMGEQARRELGNDPSVQHAAAAAEMALPPGTCDDPVLSEKLFRVRFLQQATLLIVNRPWTVDKTIAAQNRAINRCRNTRCLTRELDAIMTEMAPAYLARHADEAEFKGLCTAEAVDTPTTQLKADYRKIMSKGCGDELATTQVCKGHLAVWLSSVALQRGTKSTLPSDFTS